MRQYVIVKVFEMVVYFYYNILAGFYIMIYSHLYLLLSYDL